MDKQRFDDVTDLVEHAQKAETGPSNDGKERRVENSQGEKITLNDRKRPQIF